MSASQRRKGRTGEREVELLAIEAGLAPDRSLGGRRQPAGDVTVSGIAIEVRRRNRVRLVEWSREHEAQTPEHLVAAVAYRPDREPWRISLTLVDFLELLRERES